MKKAPYLSVFSPNAGEYGPEKLQMQTLFTQCYQLNLRLIELIFKHAIIILLSHFMLLVSFYTL